ncbi:GntR family transcriptional regulator [Phascolarctobacterium succinatutens]|uniref:GntR family transcriptional regulator n=1 Tax=Phascolarctobacterium succinatutens TaxID=626940 RepID=UPI00399551E2
MLTYDLDKRGSTPLYDYLYQCIRQDIISGRLQAGERLPSKRTLAQHLSVGIITVANAYAQLAVEGYITSREKKGLLRRGCQQLPRAPQGCSSDATGGSGA